MIRLIKDLFRELNSSTEVKNALSDTELKLVAAALMAEVSLADGKSDAAEIAELGQILIQELQFAAAEVADFIDSAKSKAAQATSLFEFTDTVNRHFDVAAKFQLIRHLWQVARADGIVHKLEEATIRKVADLIYLPHSEFIRAKQLSRS